MRASLLLCGVACTIGAYGGALRRGDDSSGSLSPQDALATTDCPSDCNGNGVCYGGRCQCIAPFGGPDCKKAMPCPVAYCSGHGVCQDGLCSCVEGWMGTGCGQEEPTPPPLPKSAKAPRVAPADDDKVKCFNDCSGHGVCGKDGKCSCVHTYGGIDCSERNLCKRNCGQRGVCVGSECVCAPGYAGELCTDRVAPKACPAHCGGRGYCVDGVCKCDLGWGGESCEKRVTVSPCAADCSYRGHCTVGSNGKHHCMCAFSYFGLDCSSQYDCPFDCSHHGLCQEGQCLCASGWGDYDCAKPVDRVDTDCPKDCSGHGVCGKDGKCECFEGFSGEDCAKKAPCKDNCSGRGKCVAGKCLCAPGFKGANCGRNVLGMEEEDLEAQMEELKTEIDAKEGDMEKAAEKAEQLAAAVPPEPVPVVETLSSDEEAALAAADAPATRASPFEDRGEPATPQVTPSKPTPEL